MARQAFDWSLAWKEVGTPLDPRAELKSPRESQSLSGALVGSGLVTRGLSWDERYLFAFLLDAQPDLTPAPSARSQKACPPRGVTDLRGQGSRSLRQGSPEFLLQCISSTRAHASTRGEASHRPAAAVRGPLLPQHPRPCTAPTAMEVLESGEQSVLQWDRKLSELSEPGETEALMYHTVRTRGQGKGGGGGGKEKSGFYHQLGPGRQRLGRAWLYQDVWGWEFSSMNTLRCTAGAFKLSSE